MKPTVVWILAALFVCAVGDVDFEDVDVDSSSDAALKCDACRAVAYKFAEYFAEAQGDLSLSTSLKNDDIIDAAESTCDDAWEGYGITEVNGEERLSGPGTGFKPDVDMDDDPIWPRRLQDMCDELLGESPDEKTLYNIWASENSLEDYLCKGEGLFGFCTATDLGGWPGDDYDDYEDGADFDYIHDEF